MKTKIIIAGVGHGGLVCGALLAEKGYDVTVYEAKKRRDIGHDWTDVFPLASFDEAGIPLPPQNKYIPSRPICYTNPNKTVQIRMPENTNKKSTNSVLDRKYLIQYLLRYAEKKGVRIRFATEVVSPITDGKRVLGLTLRKNNRISCVFADLIIDAAGIDSPVRRLLPACFGIQNEFEEDQIFTCYRACYEKTQAEEPENQYTVHFFHMREPGISWVITEKNCMDILIGHFGTTLTQEQIDEAVADLRETYPAIGETVVRGGQVARIPIRRTIPLMIADGYAAVGDCAGMTIPIIGSGIANSIRAGKYLADAIEQDPNQTFTKAALWQYQYNYFTKIGNKLVMIDKLRSLCTKLDADDVDYLLEKDILSANELASGSGSVELSASLLIQKILKSIPRVTMLANVTKTFVKANTVRRVLSEMPEEYDEETVNDWTRQYAQI